VDETQWPDDLEPRRLTEGLALAKAREVARRTDDGLVVGADTIVAAGDGSIVGKPRDLDDARRVIGRLAGSWHAIWTGVAVVNARTGNERVASEVTRLHMREMTPAEIEEYVSNPLCLERAGGYAYDMVNDPYVDRVEGSKTNIVGLPMDLVARLVGPPPRPRPNGKED